MFLSDRSQKTTKLEYRFPQVNANLWIFLPLFVGFLFTHFDAELEAGQTSAVMGTNYLTASYNYFLTTIEISSYNYYLTTLEVKQL